MWGIKTEEPVSDIFVYQTGTRDIIQALMFDDWDAGKNDVQATLKAAINARLDSFGFKGPNGVSLV